MARSHHHAFTPERLKRFFKTLFCNKLYITFRFVDCYQVADMRLLSLAPETLGKRPPCKLTYKSSGVRKNDHNKLRERIGLGLQPRKKLIEESAASSIKNLIMIWPPLSAATPKKPSNHGIKTAKVSPQPPPTPSNSRQLPPAPPTHTEGKLFSQLARRIPDGESSD